MALLFHVILIRRCLCCLVIFIGSITSTYAESHFKWDAREARVDAIVGTVSHETIPFNYFQGAKGLTIDVYCPSDYLRYFSFNFFSKRQRHRHISRCEKLREYLSVSIFAPGNNPRSTGGIRINLEVPADAKLGKYRGWLQIKRGSRRIGLPLPLGVKIRDGIMGEMPSAIAVTSRDRIAIDDSSGTRYVQDEVLVNLKSDADILEFSNYISTQNAFIIGGIAEFGMLQVRFNGDPTEETLDGYVSELRSLSYVESAQRAWDYPVTFIPDFGNDPEFEESSWTDFPAFGRNAPLEYVRFPDAWSLVFGSIDDAPNAGSGIKIGVVDTGFDFEHEDLRNNIDLSSSQPGTDFALLCDLLHGNAVAGVIGAEANNSVGITGAMWNPSLILRGASSTICLNDISILNPPFLHKYSLIEELRSAVRQGARVINGSFVGIRQDSAEAFAERADFLELIGEDCIPNIPCAQDVLFVFGVDNLSTAITKDFSNTFPAALSLEPVYKGRVIKNVLSVAGIGTEPGFSYRPSLGEIVSQGGDVSVAAPASVYTTQRANEYSRDAGASYATPLVSALAGLVFTENPSLSPADVKRIIIEGACAGGKKVEGENFYVIDAVESVKLAKSNTSVDPNDYCNEPLPADDTLRVVGTVESAVENPGLASEFFPDGVQIGDPFEILITVRTNLPDNYPSDTIGNYGKLANDAIPAVTYLEMRVGTNVYIAEVGDLESNSNVVIITNNGFGSSCETPCDTFVLTVLPIPRENKEWGFSMTIEDETASLFNSDEFPNIEVLLPSVGFYSRSQESDNFISFSRWSGGATSIMRITEP